VSYISALGENIKMLRSDGYICRKHEGKDQFFIIAVFYWFSHLILCMGDQKLSS